MSDSFWIKNEYCPKCGPVQDRSGNNLGVFSDGHKWCWACGHWEPGNGVVSLADIRQRREQQKGETGESANIVTLPHDCTNIIAESALTWLKGYGITNEEINLYKIQWSPSHRRLIFPAFNESGDVVLWQGRYFPTIIIERMQLNQARYLTRGKVDSIDAYFGADESTSDQVVVVEDFISAIKVARVCPSLCLWGSQISIARMKRIAEYYKTLIIWLDPDKRYHAARSSVKAQPYFEQVSLITTLKDPKDFSTEDIRKWTSKE